VYTIIVIKKREVIKMMLIPFPIIFCQGNNFFGSSIPKTKSGDKYTAKWWYDRIDREVNIPKLSAHLNILVSQKFIIKRSNGGYDIVKYEPNDNYSVKEIIDKIQQRLDK
jgi:hypothetical protein